MDHSHSHSALWHPCGSIIVSSPNFKDGWTSPWQHPLGTGGLDVMKACRKIELCCMLMVRMLRMVRCLHPFVLLELSSKIHLNTGYFDERSVVVFCTVVETKLGTGVTGAGTGNMLERSGSCSATDLLEVGSLPLPRLQSHFVLHFALQDFTFMLLPCCMSLLISLA